MTDGVQITSSADVEFVSLEASYISGRQGSNQQGNFNTALKSPITALVTDKYGNPVYYHPVYFDAYQGGGLIYDMNKQRVYDGQPVFSDENGVASVYWVMGPSEEVNRARATSTNLAGSGEYIATANAGQAASFYKSSGINQIGTAGHVLTEPLVCKVTDGNGDAIYNYPVKYRVTFGGGSFDNQSEVTLSTDHFGEAVVNFTLGKEAGINTVEASSSGLSGSPQYFTATGQSGDAAKMVKKSGDGYFGTVGTTVSGITVAVTDLYDNVFRGGYDILFSVISGDAIIAGSQTVSTDANGQASASVQLGTTKGEVIVQAYAAGLINNPLKFTIQAKAASPVSMSILKGDNQQGTVGRELVYPLEIKVIDSYNNPVENVGISYVKTGGSGVLLTPQLIYTNENGIARARFRLGAEQGGYQVMAVKNGLAGSPLYFDATGVANNFPLFQGLNTVISSPENQVISFNVNASDNDLDPLSYSVEGLPQGATFQALTTRRFSWAPGFTQAGDYEIHFIVRDNKGGLDHEIVNINVNNFNRLPQITSYQPVQQFLTGHKDIGETFYFSITVNDQDPDDEITYQWYYDDLLVSTNSNYSLYVSSNNINLGVHNITARIHDGYDTVERSWELTVKTPVELVSFSAELKERSGVLLKWETGYETNNAGFNLLRSQAINGTYQQVNDDLLPSDDEGVYEFMDTSVDVGRTYYYKLEDVSINGKRTEHEVVKINITRPEQFELSQNFPNPFNPVTKIYYQLPEPTRVVLKVYNLLGQEVVTLVDEDMEAGYHATHWYGMDQYGHQLSSGVYYYRMTAGAFTQAKKMVLIR